MQCDSHRSSFCRAIVEPKREKKRGEVKKRTRDMVLESLNSSDVFHDSNNMSELHSDLNGDEGFAGELHFPERTSGLAVFHMLEGIALNSFSFADDMEIKLAALEQLEKEHKPWQHSFQQLLNSPLSHDESPFGIMNQNQQQHQYASHIHMNVSNTACVPSHNSNDFMQQNHQNQNQQFFEIESCITHFSSSDLKTEAKEHSEEGVSSPPGQEPNSCVTANSSSENCTGGGFVAAPPPQLAAARLMEGCTARRKRKRSKVSKNSEEVESQRMTHIAVERNRRKQMNEHLSVLRSLMPGSYIQRGDQASVIGGAIDFVKELEQLLQSLQAQKRRRECEELGYSPSSPIPFNGFFLSPQYTSYSAQLKSKYAADESLNDGNGELIAENKSPVADIEVTMIETHASLKILSQKRPGQLLKTIAALQSLHMTILHLNITTIDQSVLYSFNVKIEDDCQLTSADEIATAVHQIFNIIHSNATN